MPELPEVQVMRSYFEEVALNKRITSVSFHDHLDKIFKSPRDKIASSLSGGKFTKTNRYGKYLFARLNSGKWLHLHFGMTGNLAVFRDEELPKYTRFVMHFEDGDKLAFCDLRKFGVIEVVDEPEAYRQEHKIGKDLLDIEAIEFQANLEPRKVAIKSALLDQKNVAGIGNWIADEMLFNCGVHPETPAKELSDGQYRELLLSGQQIVKEAIKADTHYGDFPKHFFVNYRKAGAKHPDWPNSPVERLKVGGRGTFIVPAKQQKTAS